MKYACALIALASWISAGFSAPLENKLIGVDEHGLPRIEDANKAEVARSVSARELSPEQAGLAIWALAISGYSPASAEALIDVATNKEFADNDRSTAAMGLRNYTTELPAAKKKVYRGKLREIVKSDGPNTSSEVLRVLIAWGDSSWLANELGSHLPGHPMEVEIIEGLPADRVTARLLEIYEEVPGNLKSDGYNARSNVGRALVKRKDKRGIDILDTLLDISMVPQHEGAPNHQYRHNVFAFMQRALGKDFGYEHRNCDPSIDDAIVKFREWWLRERYRFEFPKG